MSTHEEHKISSEYKIQSELTCYWFSFLLSAKSYLCNNFATHRNALHNSYYVTTWFNAKPNINIQFCIDPIYGRYMPAWKGKYASLDYALTNKMSNIKGHLLNLLWLKTFKMIRRKCKITHAQRKVSVEYFPEWHTHINKSVALKLTIYIIIFTYKENVLIVFCIPFILFEFAYLVLNLLLVLHLILRGWRWLFYRQ